MRSRIIEVFLKDNDIVHNVGKSVLKLKTRSPKAPPFLPQKLGSYKEAHFRCFLVFIFLYFAKKKNQTGVKL